MERERARFDAQVDPRAAGLDVLSYELKGQFDWTARKLRASVTVQFNPAPQSAEELVLESRVETEKVLDADNQPLSFRQEKDHLIITLNPTQPDNTVTIFYNSASDLRPDGETSAITSVSPRKGDPLSARVVYTTSEPQGASLWMPCHNDPRDRARFLSTFTMGVEERLIANGNLVSQQVKANQRIMSYATSYTLPTYLMAFAVGEFEIYTAFHGNLPVSVWTRKGLPLDAEGVLAATIHDISTYERLMVRYPFEKYALVLLPEFPAGGIEHASITFQTEDRSTQGALSADRGLSAHELGHQWFGDYVTVETWDDLWIKEGMATLLAEEASRDYEDANDAFRLFGRNFDAFDGEAIRDPGLPPDEKYTSGPYGRSGWLLTQLRSLAGEHRFWGTLKTVLTKNAFGTIGTEGFIAEFAKVLPADAIVRMRRAIAAKKVPELKAVHNGTGVELALADPDGAMVVPLEIQRIQPNGAVQTVRLDAGETTLIPNEEGALWVLEPHDVHNLPYFEIDNEAFNEVLLPRMVPSDETRRYFLQAATNAPLLTLGAKAKWNLEPTEAASLYAGLGSEEARYLALQLCCHLANRDGGLHAAAWKPVILKMLSHAPYLGLPSRATPLGLADCRIAIAGTTFLNALETVANFPETSSMQEAQLVFFSLLDQDAAHSWKVWSALGQRGPSVRSREVGLYALATRLNPNTGYALPAGEDRPKWLTLFREVAGKTEVTELQRIALTTILNQKDVAALPELAQAALHSPRRRVFARAVCVAYELTKDKADQWQAFLGLLGEMPPAVKAVTENPAQICPGVF